MPGAAAAVTLDGVTKRFGRAASPAIDAMSATIAANSVTGLVGPDGAGKTTLMRLIAGLLQPSGGTIRIGDGATAVAPAAARERIGYMPQRFGLYEELTVGENLRLYADIYRLNGSARQERTGQLLRFTNLAPFIDRLAGKLSGGMKQKLGLACALLGRPQLLLLDEPSVGVDPISRRELWQIVRDLAGSGMTVLWSTAYLDEAERCDQVLLLNQGRLLAEGTPRSFLAPLEGRTFLLELPDGSERRAIKRQVERSGRVVDAILQGSSLRIVAAAGASAPAPVDDAMARGLRAVPPRFEDAFVARLAAGTRPTATAAPSPAIVPGAHDGKAIETVDLTRNFGAFCAVDRLSFSVGRGETFGLLGPNGAGKSTAFRMLCGLLPPTGGSARVAGIDLGRARAAARERLGYMSQRFSLYAGLSVRDNLSFFGGSYGLSGRRLKQRIGEVLADFNLGDAADTLAGDLPLGFKQRLALGAALLHQPQILFLDEPTSGVDPLMRREFWSRIADLADRGVTVLVTSHFMEEAEYCDRLGIIYRGRMVATGTPGAIKAQVRSAALPDPTLEDAFIALIEAHDREHPL